MTLKQMRYAIAVARYKSFNEAAKQLYISQPNLTNAIQNLETELGFLIFKRYRKGVELTKQGKEYLLQIQGIVEQVDELEATYVESREQPQCFSVSAQHYNFPVDVLLKMIQETKGSYRFSILETKTKEVMKNVAEGISDIGILYCSRKSKSVFLRELKNMDLSFHLLSVQSPCVYLRRNHPLVEKKTIRLKDLEPYPFMTFYQGEDSSSSFTEEIVDFIKKDRIIYIEDKSSGWHIMKYTDAYSVGSGMLDSDWTEDVITLPLSGCDEMNIGWIQKKNVALSAQAEYFLKLAKKALDTVS